MTRRLLLLAAVGAVIAALIVITGPLLPQEQWKNEPLHSAMEAGGALAAIMMGFFLLFGKNEISSWNRSPVALGFVGMGILDIFHAVSGNGQAFVFLRDCASITGGLGFALAWLPAHPARKAIGRWGAWIVAGLCIALGAGSLIWQDYLPRMAVMPDAESYMADTFTGNALLLNGLAMVLYLIGGIKFFIQYMRSGRIEDGLFTCFSGLLVISAATFPLAPVWDTEWWQWHVIRLTAYLAVLVFLIWEYAQMAESLSRHRDHLQELVEARTTALFRSQSELMIARDGLEARVRERTAELAEINEELHAEIEERRQAQELIHARLRLMEFAAGHTLEELLVKTLDEIGELIGSPIGFFHFLEADQKTLLLQAWSTRTEKEYCTAKGKGDHYGIDEAGVWVDCVHERRPVIHNDYASLPHRKGLPAGHAPLIRELVVPIFRGERIVSILGVGNKATGYDQTDVDVISYMADVAWEIAERKRAEEANTRLAAIIESSDDAILSKTLDGIVTSWNAGAEAMYGFRTEEIVGKPIAILVPPDKKEELDGILRCISREEHVDHLETVRLRKDGTRIDVSITISPVRNAAGTIIGASTIARNITERKRAEEALQKIMADLQCSNQELEQFAYVASHDLQEPLRMVSSFTQLLSRRYSGKLDKDADEFIAFAVDGATRMQRLINDLLAYSRVGTDKKQFEPVACESVFNLALRNLQIAIEEQHAEVEHGTLPTILAVEGQMVQLFQNLVGNAIKFHGEEPPRVGVSAERRGSEWVFSVRDNGIGIDAQYLERIFVIFQRLHERGKYPGTGIGLAVCQKIVQRHGGRIWAESEPGKGSIFFFTIPIREGKQV